MKEELFNLDAERHVLGGILTTTSDFHKVSAIVRAADFYRPENREIYATMAEMILTDHVPDVVTLPEELKKRGRLEALGGIRYTSYLANIGNLTNIAEKAEIVASYSRRRRLIEKARELEVIANDLEQEPNTATFCNDLEGISQRNEQDTGDMGAAVLELMATLNRRETAAGIQTGLEAIDGYIGGFEPGELITIAGRPGHGKSALAGTIAVNLARKGRKILIFSMEMGKGELAGRFVSRLSKIPGEVMKRPASMTAEQRAALQKGIDALKLLPITISTQDALTPGDIANTAARVKRGAGLDVVIIDYLQLMSSGRKSDAGNRVQEISYITRTLKNLAKRLNLPIILLSQLSRANEKEKSNGQPRLPQLTDLRDSGSIEQDSNTVLLLQRKLEGDELSEKTAVNIAKQRNGKTGLCMIEFKPEYTYFTAYDASIEVPY